MPLQVLPLKVADIPTIQTYTSTNGGPLTDPLLLDCWRIDSPADELKRNAWDAEQRTWRLLNDRTAHFVKVVDSERPDEIISVARWHYYDQGYSVEDAWMEIDCLCPPTLSSTKAEDRPIPRALDMAGLRAFIDEASKQRAECPLTKGPCWILTSLITRISHRRRGAAGMLVDWGIKRAQKDGFVAFLEAEPDAVRLYAKHGFVQYRVVSGGGNGDGDGEEGQGWKVVQMYKEPGS